MSPRTPKLRSVDEGAEAPADEAPDAGPAGRMRLTADRILVRVPDDSEHKSKGGLLIPATATTPMKRCIWSDVVRVWPSTRNIRAGEQILFIPLAGLEALRNGAALLLLR